MKKIEAIVRHHTIEDIKSALIGPSETIPIVEGRLTLGTWQNIFLCEFDGPRRSRRVIVSVLT